MKYTKMLIEENIQCLERRVEKLNSEKENYIDQLTNIDFELNRSNDRILELKEALEKLKL